MNNSKENLLDVKVYKLLFSCTVPVICILLFHWEIKSYYYYYYSKLLQWADQILSLVTLTLSPTTVSLNFFSGTSPPLPWLFEVKAMKVAKSLILVMSSSVMFSSLYFPKPNANLLNLFSLWLKKYKLCPQKDFTFIFNQFLYQIFTNLNKTKSLKSRENERCYVWL